MAKGVVCMLFGLRTHSRIAFPSRLYCALCTDRFWAKKSVLLKIEDSLRKCLFTLHLP